MCMGKEIVNRERLLQALRDEVPEHRFRHTLGVMEAAVRLAERYGADPAKAEMAAILHDIAKYWPVERLRAAVQASAFPQDVLAYDAVLWHGPVAAEVARTRFGVTDEDVLNAIRYHTTGRPGMSVLEKVVCLADYIEPGRQFPGVDEIRRLAEADLDAALAKALGGTIAYLISRGMRVYPLTLLAYNDLIGATAARDKEGGG